MIEIKATQVTYEALGRVHVTYTTFFDIDYIQNVVKLIDETARVTDLKNAVIDSAIYKKNNLSHIKDRYKEIEQDE